MSESPTDLFNCMAIGSPLVTLNLSVLTVLTLGQPIDARHAQWPTMRCSLFSSAR